MVNTKNSAARTCHVARQPLVQCHREPTAGFLLDHLSVVPDQVDDLIRLTGKHEKDSSIR